MKKLILFITLVFAASLFSINSNAQITKGGSEKNWEKYSVIYDTVITQEVVKSAYPSTSQSYISFGILSGQGLMAEPQTFGFPEDGYKGTGGHDFSRLWELSYGNYMNYESLNKKLHPAIDLSGNFNVFTQFGTPDFENNPAPEEYTVDYGLYFGLGIGYGAIATFKPYYVIPNAPKALEDLKIDGGLRVDAVSYFYGETTYTLLGDDGYISGAGGMRLDRSIIIGARYKFFGVRFELARELADILNAEAEHGFAGDFEYFNTAVDHDMNKIVFSIYF